jgi:hypothetical protein
MLKIETYIYRIPFDTWIKSPLAVNVILLDWGYANTYGQLVDD